MINDLRLMIENQALQPSIINQKSEMDSLLKEIEQQ